MFSITPNPYHIHAGHELDWLPMDTKQLFDLNLTSNYSDLEKNGWITNPFTYKFNQYGFRSDEFTTDDSILFLGCSFTLGVGVPYEHTWATKVSNSLGLRNYNLGIGGGSNDTAFRMASCWIPQLKPKIVIFLTTAPERLELVTSNGRVINYAPSSNNISDFYKQWILADENSSLNQQKNIFGIQSICNAHSIKFTKFNYNELANINTTSNDVGRDLVHPGTNNHHVFSEIVLSKL